MNKKELLGLVNKLPQGPGVYIFKSDGKIIYIGKAISLRKRVKSYFNYSYKSSKTSRLSEQIDDIEYIITDTENEALILESNLVKKHQPKYNIDLKDDKRYPYIKLTTKEKYPRLFLVRKKEIDGAKYFGPYTHIKQIRSILKLISQLYPLRTCRNRIKDKKPCLNYSMHNCMAPCSGRIDYRTYQILVNKIKKILKGDYENIILELNKKMNEASREEKYENAAYCRDLLFSFENLKEKQKVVTSKNSNWDVIGYKTENGRICCVVFIVRSGKLIQEKHFFAEIKELTFDEMLFNFMNIFYGNNDDTPDKIVLKVIPGSIGEVFLDRGRDKIIKAKTREQKDLIRLADKNAQYFLRTSYPDRDEIKNSDKIIKGLADKLNLSGPPGIIEAFDISNISGNQPVGSMAYFENGTKKPAEYRKFKIKTITGIDDVKMIAEIVKRRYERLLGEGKKLPDMILIDGGITQVNSAYSVLKGLGISDIPVFGLAKREEKLYKPGDNIPIKLPDDSKELVYLKSIRDEAHRFAVKYHRLRRKKDFMPEPIWKQ